jgi:glycosyltransferase involved in cell wall biosynthesis
LEVSVVIPVNNEEKSIKNTVDEIMNSLNNTEINYEIIIVNDGSVDNTSQVIEEIHSMYKDNVNIIQNKKNGGYGFSLKRGIKSSKFSNIFITDADGTYPNNRMAEFVKYYYENKLDMLIGARDKKQIPLIRRPAKAVLNMFANYISGFKIPDLNSGFRIFSKSIALKYFGIIPDGFSFTSTITLSMFSEKGDIEYLPIEYNKRDGKSKIRPIKDTLNFFSLVFRTILYFNPLKIFVPFSFMVWLSGIGVFVYSYLYMDNLMDITTIVLLLTSVQIFSIGLVADLVVKRSVGGKS